MDEAGGSYLVTGGSGCSSSPGTRTTPADQETIFGRRKNTGAPLTGRSEFDLVDLSAKAPDGSLVIDADAHIRLAAPSSHGGQRILRRGYSYTDGN